jgi:N-acetyl-gamma-glutamyl-phosphate reductase
MVKVTGLTRPPVFCPIVDDYYKGMATSIGLHAGLLSKACSAEDIRQLLAEHYRDQRFVRVAPELGSGTLYADFAAGRTSWRSTVSGERGSDLVTPGSTIWKGASGAPCIYDIMWAVPEEKGLEARYAYI